MESVRLVPALIKLQVDSSDMRSAWPRSEITRTDSNKQKSIMLADVRVPLEVRTYVHSMVLEPTADSTTVTVYTHIHTRGCGLRTHFYT